MTNNNIALNGLKLSKLNLTFSNSFSNCHCKNICCCLSKSSYAVCSLDAVDELLSWFELFPHSKLSSSNDELDFFIRFGP